MIQNPSGSRLKSVLSTVDVAIRTHMLFIVVVCIHCAAAVITGRWLGMSDKVGLTLYQRDFFASEAAMAAMYFGGRVLYMMVVERPDQLTRAIGYELRSRYLTSYRLINALPILFFLPLSTSAFTALKILIPVIRPYDWDSTFAAWDRTLHGGHAPWELLQPVLGHYLVTAFINLMYNLWFAVLIGCLFWQTFSMRDMKLRLQFFISFVLCLGLLGDLAAAWLSSAGPCFYGRIVPGPDPYAPLMDYLHAANAHGPAIWALGVQDMLWNQYATGTSGIGSGISAMPSVHLATSTLFALLGWRTSRRVGIILTIYLLIILVGSTHLAWHYGVDGYAAILGAAAIWWAVGWAVPSSPRPATAASCP